MPHDFTALAEYLKVDPKKFEAYRTPAAIAERAKQFGNARIVVEGHTDSSMRGVVPPELVPPTIPVPPDAPAAKK